MIRKVQERAQQIISGFKSPADDYLEGRLDITSTLVIDPHCTFYFRMSTDCMSTFNIPENAILIVDRSLKAIDGAVIIAPYHGELICRVYKKSNLRTQLVSDDETISFKDGNTLEIWGVVIAVCYGVLPKGLKKGRYSNVCIM